MRLTAASPVGVRCLLSSRMARAQPVPAVAVHDQAGKKGYVRLLPFVP